MGIVSSVIKSYAKNVAKRSARGAEKQAIKDAAVASGKTETQAANKANYEMAKKAGKSKAIERMPVKQSREDSKFVTGSDKGAYDTLKISARDTKTGKKVSTNLEKDVGTSRTISKRQADSDAGEAMYRGGLKNQAKKDAAKVGAAGAVTSSVLLSKSDNESKKETKKDNTDAQKARSATRMNDVKSKSGSSDSRINKADYPTYKKGSESGAAFRKAHKAASDAGQKTFTFEGRRYTTDKK